MRGILWSSRCVVSRTMKTSGSWMVWHSGHVHCTVSGLQGFSGQPDIPLDNTTHGVLPTSMRNVLCPTFVCARFRRVGSSGRGIRRGEIGIFWFHCALLVDLGVLASSAWINHAGWRGHSSQGSTHSSGRPLPSRSSRWVGRGIFRRQVVSEKVLFWFWCEPCSFSGNVSYCNICLVLLISAHLRERDKVSLRSI